MSATDSRQNTQSRNVKITVAVILVFITVIVGGFVYRI